MTPPLTGQRSRSELIAELYERHAAGLFAYCHDQLGETASAADAVVAVFTTVPVAEPPSRAALYALARREIYRRDVSYALPAVDSVADPATALIERVFRDIRPHQREVLLLSEVCGLTAPELSLVLDVAVDTAGELVAGARRRFAQTLETAVTAARSAPFVPSSVAEVYDAIGVAPIADVLARLPWRRPSATVRTRVLAALPYEEPAIATGREQASSGPALKKLWPTTPTWPLPLSDPDQVTNTCVVKADAITPQGPRRKAKHEATTEPMPRLRGALLNSLTEGRLRRRRPGRPERPAPERPAALAAPVEPQEPPRSFPPAPGAQDPARDSVRTPAGERAQEPAQTTTAGPDPGIAAGTFDAFRPVDPFDVFRPAEPFDAFRAPDPADTTRPADPLGALFDTLRYAEPFDAFRQAEHPGATPQSWPGGPAHPAEQALPSSSPRADDSPDEIPPRPSAPRPADAAAFAFPPAGQPAEASPPSPGTAGERSPGTAGERSAGTARSDTTHAGKHVSGAKKGGADRANGTAGAGRGRRERHYDWLWEIGGFLICLIIALIVFFA